MIDWFTGVVSYDASGLRPDVIYKVDRDGNIVWETECWMECEGSYSDKMRIRRKAVDQQLRLWIPDQCEDRDLAKDFLQLSGNPVKYLQGHNAFGPSVTALDTVVTAAVCALPAEVRPVGIVQGELPRVKGSRVDIAVMVQLGSHDDVHSWLNAMARGSRSRHGRALVSGDTVYWGKHSRRWSLKAYCKYCEMAVRGVADQSINRMLREYVKGQLRIELTLRSQELKENRSLDESVVWKYFDRLSMGVLEMSRIKEIEILPLASQAVVLKWLNGEDVRMQMKVRNFYRHRSLIMDLIDVDISAPRMDQEKILSRIKYDGKYLRDHEVKGLPQDLEKYLFKPGVSTAFSLS